MEPFEDCAYLSQERVSNRYDGRKPKDPRCNYTNTINRLLALGEHRRLFIKDHAYHFRHIVDDRFLSSFQHTFLIRDPAEALPSYFHILPDLSLFETGYKELYELFELVRGYTGKTPPLVDAGDLLIDPEATVRAYCECAEIPFVKRALNWKPVAEPFGQFKDAWYRHFRSTTGFMERPRRSYPEVSENKYLFELYEQCLPYYEKLYNDRIRI